MDVLKEIARQTGMFRAEMEKPMPYRTIEFDWGVPVEVDSREPTLLVRAIVSYGGVELAVKCSEDLTLLLPTNILDALEQAAREKVNDATEAARDAAEDAKVMRARDE